MAKMVPTPPEIMKKYFVTEVIPEEDETPATSSFGHYNIQSEKKSPERKKTQQHFQIPKVMSNKKITKETYGSKNSISSIYSDRRRNKSLTADLTTNMLNIEYENKRKSHTR